MSKMYLFNVRNNRTLAEADVISTSLTMCCQVLDWQSSDVSLLGQNELLGKVINFYESRDNGVRTSDRTEMKIDG